MEIDRIYYPVYTLGPGKRIGIWTIGCPHHCKGCSNPELWSPNPSKDINVDRIVSYVQQCNGAEGITITGGDPFFQVKDLAILTDRLRKLGFEDILVYTGYTLSELNKRKETNIENALERIGVLIDGRYIENRNDNKSIRGSNNQNIIIINPRLNEIYKDVEKWPRQTQLLINDGNVMAIGLPMKDN